MAKVKVLVVDDSVVVRKVVSEILSRDSEIEVVGTAENPLIAREKIKQLNPDVLTLDVEMPEMDGVTFLRNLMRLRPMPVVMLSTLTTEGADITLEALELGAVDFIAKPRSDLAKGLERFAQDLITKVKAAASSRAALQRLQAMKRTRKPATLVNASGRINSSGIIAIGASTGGTEAIRDVLIELPREVPPIVITQHIPESFSGRFANRLNTVCALSVCEAQSGQKLEPGCAYIAPGNKHLEIVAESGGYRCRLSDDEPVNRHRPAVDKMFDSLLQCQPRNVTAVLLTGMGNDGAAGMLALRKAGAYTVAQDEQSSLVWGMPGSAVKMNAAVQVKPLSRIASVIMDQISK
ncbi:protein-glutamate methylesterase/protein-glutamine glutaminase [Marinobacterium jannaschii]|uniref:protein-glutamate methylesterase/protein-glutamine glutaminase n=1 Tax=Marinobacterium jannaschii TaxID=64970 RepID=UPI0004895C29|nr:chemotaxis response regulator protein-glutamate methylesterase [Marinobacterium jannaschii]